MKNNATILFVGVFLLAMVLGCGRVVSSVTGSGSNSNKTLTDKGVDIAVGDEKIGIPECDEVIDFFDKEMNNPDDDLVTKAAKRTILNQLKEQFKAQIEQNKTDKVQLAKTCKDFKTNLDKYKAEEDTKKAANK